MSGAFSRNKGAAFERKVAELYREAGFKNARRKLSQYQKSDGRDLENVDPFTVQCKCGKTVDWLTAYHEALASNEPSFFPVVHGRIDGKGTYVFLSEEDWQEIVIMLKGNDII
jgi:hypothetical protein